MKDEGGRPRLILPWSKSHPSPNCWWSSFVCPWRIQGSAFSSYFLVAPDLNFDSRILLQARPHAVAGQGLHHDHLVGDNEPCGVFGVISTNIYIFLRFQNIHVFWIIMPNLNYITLFDIWHFYNVSNRPNTCMRNMYALSRLTCE